MTLHAIHLTLQGTEPPKEVLLFPFGDVATEKGTFKFTQTSARLILERFKRWGIDFGFDYDHGTLNPKVPPKDRKASGWATSSPGRPGGLEVRGSGLWATNIEWTPDAYTAIKKKEFRYLSPGNVVTNKDGEIIDLWNCALVTLPATHNAIPLTFANHFCLSVTEDGKGRRINMTTVPNTTDTTNAAAAPPAKPAAAAPTETTPVQGGENSEFYSLLGQYLAGTLSLLQENMSNPDPSVTDICAKFMNSDFAKIATEYMDAAKARNPNMTAAALSKPALALSIIQTAEKVTGKQGLSIPASLLNLSARLPAKPTVDLNAQVKDSINKEFDRGVAEKKLAPGDDNRKRFHDDLSTVSLSMRPETAKLRINEMEKLSEKSLTAENLSVADAPRGKETPSAIAPATADKDAHLKGVSSEFASFLKSIPDPGQNNEP